MEKSDDNQNQKNSSTLFDPCLVCGVPTSKLHLQINACYACAAFFRRSINSQAIYKCHKFNNKCDVTVKTIGKPLCRLCRYNKCIKVGMKINNNKSQDNIPYDINIEEEQKDFLSLNFDEIYSMIEKVFNETSSINKKSEINFTLQFMNALTKFIEDFKPEKNLLICNDYRNNERLNFIMKHFVESAKMLSKYSPFSSLPLAEKLKLHGQFWQNFRLFERLYQTQIHFGIDSEDSRLIVDYTHYADISKHITKERKISTGYTYFEPLIKRCKRYYAFFKRTNITLFEFAYISQIVLWSNYNLPTLDKTIQNYVDKIIKQIHDDLHQYYVNNLRISAYAGRQAQLLRLINFGNTIVSDKNEMLSAQTLFDDPKTNSVNYRFEIDHFTFIKKCSILNV